MSDQSLGIACLIRRFGEAESSAAVGDAELVGQIVVLGNSGHSLASHKAS